MARGGGNVTYVGGNDPRFPPRVPGAFEQVTQALPSIVQSFIQAKYMQQLQQKAQMEMAQSQQKAFTEQVGNRTSAQELLAMQPHMQPGQPAQPGQQYQIPTSVADNSGRIVSQGAPIAGQDPGTPEVAPGFMHGAVDEVTLSRISDWRTRLAAAKAGGDERMIRALEAEGSQIRGGLTDNIERAHTAREVGRAMMSAVKDLPAEQREHQIKVIKAYEAAIRGGLNPQALDGIGRDLAPNIVAMADVADKTMRAKQAGNQIEADKIFTPLALKDQGIDPATAPPDLVIFGASSKWLDNQYGIQSSNRFRENNDRDHQQTMTEIEARNANGGGRGGLPQGWETRTVVETAIARAQRSYNQAPRPITEVAEEVLGELQMSYPGIFTAAVAAELRGQDPQVMTDYAWAREHGVTPQKWPEVERALLSSGRTPQQIAETKKLLADTFVRTGPARSAPSTPPRFNRTPNAELVP